MADTLESEFILKFHAISGITLKERNQNLNQLLKKTQDCLQQTSKNIDLSALQPTTPLEANFKIQALIYFKCEQQLFDILKTENPIHIDQVLKHSGSFLKEAFSDITPECLVTQIFPNLSYTTKEKLLHKLSVSLDDAKKCDKYFEAVKETYGLYLASKLVSSCSCELLRKYVELYKIEITASQLLKILKKEPNLTEWIFEKLNERKVEVGVKYQIVFKYLAMHDVSLFLKLYCKYHPKISLGPKETDTFINKCIKINGIENVEISQILNHKQIAKTLGNDFEKFYYKFLSKSINELKNNLDFYLKFLDGLPSNVAKLDMFMTTFKKIYGNEIWEHSDFMIPKLIEWMSSADRETFVEKYSRPPNILEENWFTYHKTETSIPLLMGKISVLCSMKARTRYILALLKTCKLNNDKPALLEVLKYLNNKHRNENYQLLQEAISTLSNYYKPNFFTNDHWVEIKQCVQYFMVNNTRHYHCFDLLQKYICYRFSHNLSITEDLKNWTKVFPHTYCMFTKNCNFDKTCLAEFENIILQDFQDEDCIRYLYEVSMYNKNNPKDKLVLNIKEEFVQCIKRALKDEGLSYNYNAYIVAGDLIITDFARAEETGIVTQLLSANYLYDLKPIIWLIKSKPEVLLKHVDIVLLDNDSRNYSSHSVLLNKLFRMYTHLKIPAKITKLCYEIINNEKSEISKFKMAATSLSMQLTPADFLRISQPFYPNEVSLSVNVKNKKNMYKERAIIDALVNVIPLSEAWDGILQFCKGDYLKLAQRPLVLASLNTVEQKLPSFFHKLSERAISVGKHAILLQGKCLNNTQRYKMLLDLKQKERNPSILLAIFKTAFGLFLQNTNEHFWAVFTQCAKEINFATDEQGSALLTNAYDLPNLYFAKYLEFAWNILHTYNVSSIMVENGKVNLLNLVTPVNVPLLPFALCVNIIEQNLFKCNLLTDFQKSVHSFACKFLIYASGNEDERLKYIFNLLANLKDEKSSITELALKYKLTYNFIQQLCGDVMEKNCTNRGVFQKFLQMWESIYKPYEAFDEFVYLHLTYIYVISIEQKLNITEIGERIVLLCDSLGNQNCLDMTGLKNHLSSFVEKFYSLDFIGKSDENEIALINSIVNMPSGYKCLELVLVLMPSPDSVTPITKQRWDKIIYHLTTESNHFLQIAFQNYLRNSIKQNDYDDLDESCW